MPIRSMTGFGRETVALGASGEGPAYAVELRAVNHRFLEFRLRVPPAMGHLEATARTLLGARLRRGRVDLSIAAAVEDDTAVRTSVAVNLPLARSLVTAHARLSAECGVPLRMDTAILASFPGVLSPAGETGLDAVTERALLAAVERARDALLAMREAEGRALSIELTLRLSAAAALIERISERAPEQSRSHRSRLEARMRELLAGHSLETDQGRLLQEVAVFSEKSDIAEELARLRSHVNQARSWVVDDVSAGEEGVGRRLDFLCQEMNREVNTIGSKVHDLSVTEWVIELKAELERLREQVQNVE